MSRGLAIFIVLLIINVILTIVYLIWNLILKKEKRGSVWMKAAVMLLVPVIGPMFILFSYLFFRLFSSQGMDLSDVIFDKDKKENFLRVDEEMEKNMVSLEEALEVTDKKSLRTLMMNVIRGDYQKSLSAITLALNSEDSETAHYASSVLQDVLNNFRKEAQEKYVLSFQEDDQQVRHCIEFVEFVDTILSQKVLTDLEQKSMTKQMEEVLAKAWEIDETKIGNTVYEKVCARLLDVGAYELCEEWSKRAYEQYPNELSSYTCQLKLYFACGNKEAFFRVMEELRNQDIAIDNETLEMIRTFM